MIDINQYALQFQLVNFNQYLTDITQYIVILTNTYRYTEEKAISLDQLNIYWLYWLKTANID